MIGDNIRKYRKVNNMSQDDLAEKLDVTRQSISLWENGQTQPSLENILALAKLFNVTADDLLAETTDDNCIGEEKIPSAGTENEKKKKTILICAISAAVLVVLVLVLVFVLKGCNNAKTETGEKLTSGITSGEETSSGEEVSEPDKSTTGTDGTDNTTAGGNSSATQEKSGTSSATSKATQETSGKTETKDLYGYLKNFAINNGKINGDYCYYSKTSDNYGGYADEDFSLFYWGDTEKVEFSLHCPLDDTYSINFYLQVPKNNNGTYDYITSYYYRDTGEAKREAKGTIKAAEFTSNYPLNCSKYIGETEKQNSFMEESRIGMCDLIKCLKKFCEVENLEYSFSDFGFKNF